MDPTTQPAGTPGTVERRDGSVLEQWDVPARTYRRYDDGQLAVEREFTDAEDAWAVTVATEQQRRATQAALLERACADLAANQAYLDKAAAGTATVEDAVAQVAELTRQALGFIRLTVGGELLD